MTVEPDHAENGMQPTRPDRPIPVWRSTAARLAGALRLTSLWQKNWFKAVRPGPDQWINVRVYTKYGDASERLDRALPNKNRSWKNVKFWAADPPADPIHRHLILDHAGLDPVTITAQPDSITFAVGEPPGPVHRALHSGQGEGTHVFTPDAQFARTCGLSRQFHPSPCMTPAWSVAKTIDELSTLSPAKTKKLSWVTSNLNRLAGHKARMAFLARAQAELDFDLFGRGFHELDDKWDGLAPYEYSIAYENTVANLYFTEKLMDCFVSDAVPFYCGAPNVLDYFPEKAIIRIDPDDPKVFHKIKDVLNFDDRAARADAMREAKRITLYEQNMFIRLAEHFASQPRSNQRKQTFEFNRVRPKWDAT